MGDAPGDQFVGPSPQVGTLGGERGPQLRGGRSLEDHGPCLFVDAHEEAGGGKDFGLVTRTFQSNTTQQWIIKRL